MILTNPHARTVNATPLLSNASWVSLRELTLLGLTFISAEAELGAFLVSHPTIEVLSLVNVQIDEPLVLPAGVLPRLKTLEAGSAVIDSILNSPTSSPRPLEDILWVSLNGVFLDKLENSGSGTTLKELGCMCESNDDLGHLITRLSSIAPNLEGLYIIDFDTIVPVVSIKDDATSGPSYVSRFRPVTLLANSNRSVVHRLNYNFRKYRDSASSCCHMPKSTQNKLVFERL